MEIVVVTIVGFFALVGGIFFATSRKSDYVAPTPHPLPEEPEREDLNDLR